MTQLLSSHLIPESEPHRLEVRLQCFSSKHLHTSYLGHEWREEGSGSEPRLATWLSHQSEQGIQLGTLNV